MKTLLLTGGIGSGKSAVAACLEARGIPVYDSDSRAKLLYDSDLIDSLEAALGVCLRRDSRFSPAALSAAVFSSPEALSKVESLVHPAVLKDFLRWRDARDAAVVAFESAIAMSKPLFDGLWDAVLMVTAPLPTRVERVMRRSGLTREPVMARIAAQQFDIMKADAVINNDLDIETLAYRTEIALKLLYL